MPDLIGYTLGSAKKILEAAEIKCSVIVTAAPRDQHNDYNDNFRVIRSRALSQGRAELLVCKDMNA